MTLLPGRRDQRDRHPRPRPVGGRAAHPRVRDGPGRRGVRGDPRRPARPAPRAVRADGRPAARARSLDRRPARPTSRRPATTPSAARPSPAPSSRPVTRRASRTHSGACSAWGKPAYVPRTGLGPLEAIAAIRAAAGLPVLAHFGEAAARVEVVRELVEAGLGGLEVYYRSFDVATVASVGRGRHRARRSSRPAAPTTTATPARTPRRTPSCGSRRRSRTAVLGVGSPAQP